MKYLFSLLFLLALVAGVPWSSFGQAAVVAEITKLEETERQAVLKGDTVTLQRLWTKDFVINNPQNKVATARQAMVRFRSGLIDYATYDQTIEKITVNGNVAVTMGHEVLKPQRKAENAGKTVTRRFTNVWVQTAGTWKMMARQTTNILVQ